MSDKKHSEPVLYLLDIDGTLMLSSGAGRTALDQAFAELHGLSGAMDGITLAGRTDPLIIEDMFVNKLGRSSSDQDQADLLAAYLPLLKGALQTPGRAHMMPAVIPTLDFLAGCRGVHLAIATGNVRAGAQIKLESVGLWERFITGGFGDDSADRAEMVARGIARAEDMLGIAFARARIVVVGDTPRDVAAARACGIRVLAVATGGYSSAQLEQTDADAVFATLAELPDWHRAHLQ